MKLITVSIVALLALGGCTRTIWVQEQSLKKSGAEPSSVPGVPFYVKTEKFLQTTNWSQTWIEATLKIEKTLASESNEKDKPSISQSFSVNLTKAQLEQVSDLKQKILNTDRGSQNDANEMVALFRSIEGAENPAAIEPILMSNVISSEWIVDGTKKYYINAPLPWFGTNTLSQELNADGTLAKASSAPDTKLAESVASLIPLSEYLTGRFVTPLTEVPTEEIDNTVALMNTTKGLTLSARSIKESRQSSAFVFLISLELSEKGYVYKFTKQHDVKPVTATPIAFDLESEYFEREQLTGSKPVPKEDEEKNTIGIKGSITLPEVSTSGT